ncbi:sugar (pentulose or hexulose) kinase [Bradyrhizobium sp. USDA 372]
MLSPDYQEFANRGSPATRDNTVISGLGTSEVIENAPALLDCHEKQARKRNFLLAAGRKTAFCAARTRT